MTKRKVLFVLTIALLLLINVRVNAGNPMDINLDAGYVDPYKGNDAPQRSPIQTPHVGIDDYALTFYTPCDGDTLRLLDDNDNVVFATLIPIGTTTLVLPSYLSGTYQIQIISGNICFWGYIELL